MYIEEFINQNIFEMLNLNYCIIIIKEMQTPPNNGGAARPNFMQFRRGDAE